MYWIKVLVIYFRGLFSDKKTKLIYSNGLSQVHLSSPFSDGGNRKVYKTCLKLSIETRSRRLAKEGAVANTAEWH